ncbi:histidine kinase [Chryseobacterium phosphatilyticum]|uniref:Histidine kinase n=1 Tax=Chryseobacterium phosphatilyticum TaxID=475075 RepID=A0A316XCV0_9FLAO|nr:2TM domain-containing protein [Chryseobacterium phosphatilyticum]PWN68620.1 histidine kinase [Chryseobacterium phosphatilyticum]
METFTNKDELAYRKATRRVKELKGFYGNLTSYCVIIPFLAILNVMTAPGYLWFLWPMLGWGIGVTFHAVSVFGLGKQWEERKIKQLMDEDRKNIKTL